MASPKRSRRRFGLIAAGIIIAVSAALFLLPDGRSGEMEIAQVQGWCCVESGSSCLAGYSILDCYNAGAVAFDVSEKFCSLACSASQ
ncbi:MAG: hypothetical protein G01um101425_368 [Candidatus Peregrinibacteria bacterium Gr01-1014_25]|nr:MAG: hypothetical protein G01um101425_368 [Candidatus Peregrinibacteria bacterium Gr01-1014_25]